MKAWHVFLFVYILQLLLVNVLPYYGITPGTSAVVLSETDLNTNTSTSISDSNEYLQQTLYQQEQFSNPWNAMTSSLLPTGSFLDTYFPSMPGFLILLFNSLWGILTTLAVIEFIRGFNITSR